MLNFIALPVVFIVFVNGFNVRGIFDAPPNYLELQVTQTMSQ